MSDVVKKRIGLAAVAVGAILLIVGTVMAHFTGLATHDAVGRPIYPNIPRCLWFEGEESACWIVPTIFQTTAFIGSQILMVGIFIGWIFERRMTWALATVAAFIFTVEIIVIFGIVPNEMLALFQGPLDWSDQRIFWTVPTWLVLGNDVQISYAVLKDMVVAGFTTTMLVVLLVGTYQAQEWSHRRGQPKPPSTSLYGRPVTRGGG